MAAKTYGMFNDEAFKVGSDAMTKGYEQMVALAREQVGTAMPKAIKAFDEMANFGKGNVDAALKAGKIAANGWETIGREVANFNKTTLETGVANARALFGAKTLKEAIELQTGFARAAYDTFMSEGTKLSEMTIKVAQETAEPISVRVNQAVEKVGKPLAA